MTQPFAKHPVSPIRYQQTLALGVITSNFATLDYFVGEMVLGFPGAPREPDVDRMAAGWKGRELERLALTLSEPIRRLVQEFVKHFLDLTEERNNLIHGCWNLSLEGEPQNGPAWLNRKGERMERPPEMLWDFANRIDPYLLVMPVFEALRKELQWSGGTLSEF